MQIISHIFAFLFQIEGISVEKRNGLKTQINALYAHFCFLRTYDHVRAYVYQNL